MLIGHKNSSTLIAEIRMLRTLANEAILVVEGADDRRFWSAPQRACCELVIGEGKNNVVGCVRRLDGSRYPGVLGVVDDDYDSFTGTKLGSVNLVSTEVHDLECLLCRSSALDVVLVEYGDSERIRQFERSSGVDVRMGLLNRAVIFGRLRLAARLFELDIDVRAINIPRFVDRQSWNVDAKGLVRAVVENSPSVDESSLHRSLTKLPRRVDPWLVARGHDLVQILSIGLINVLGQNRRSIGADQVSRLLRAGIPLSDLRSTRLWRRISAWENTNTPYLVLTPSVDSDF